MRLGWLLPISIVFLSPTAEAGAHRSQPGHSDSSGHSPSGGHRSSEYSHGSHPSGSASSSSGESRHRCSPSASSSHDLAERRHPRAGTRACTHQYPRYYPFPHYRPYYGSLYSGGPPYDGFYYDYGPSPDRGDIRLMVDPNRTRVYVDGDYAGVADDFAGLSQRLHVAPGRHEITLALEGHRTHRLRVDLLAGETLTIRHDMQEGAAEDPLEDLSGEADLDRSLDQDRGPAGQDTSGRPRLHDTRETGRLRLQVRPDDSIGLTGRPVQGDGLSSFRLRSLDR